MKVKNLFDGFRSFNWDFWRRFPEDPKICFGFLYLAIFLFVADTLWFILTPKEVRDAWER